MQLTLSHLAILLWTRTEEKRVRCLRRVMASWVREFDLNQMLTIQVQN